MSAATDAQGKKRKDELAASKEAALAAYEKLLEARQHFRQAAEAAGMDLKDEAMQQLEYGKARATELADEATRYTREKPLASLGIAFLAGYILAVVFGRR
ncbi:MAG: hypothetical protein ACK5HY_03980 [Parahaliea sp.]